MIGPDCQLQCNYFKSTYTISATKISFTLERILCGVVQSSERGMLLRPLLTMVLYYRTMLHKVCSHFSTLSYGVSLNNSKEVTRRRTVSRQRMRGLHLPCLHRPCTLTLLTRNLEGTASLRYCGLLDPPSCSLSSFFSPHYAQLWLLRPSPPLQLCLLTSATCSPV